MADDAAVPNLDGLVDALVEGLFDPAKLTRLQHANRNSQAEALTIAKGVAFAALDAVLERLGAFFFGIEEHFETVAGPPLARIVGHLLGQEITTSELRESATRSGDPRVGRLVAEMAFNALSGDATELKPDSAPAKKFLTLIAQLIVNGWFEGTAFELLTTVFPDMDSFESVAELPHELVDALGLGRLARVALRPLAQTLIATPLTWELNKRLTPSLLSESAALRAFIAGKWDNGQLREELSRQGWSDDRIDVLLSQQYKNLSLDDMLLLERHGATTRPETLAILNLEGYDQTTAQLATIAADARRSDSLDDNVLPTLLSAYVNREIDRGQLQTLFPPNVFTDLEQSAYLRDADTRRALNVRHMSAGEVIDCVKLGILPTAFYRAWLVREGYPDDEALALELRLRAEIDKETSIEDHRKAVDAERAAEKAAKDKEKADRLAKAEAERALARRGPLSDLRQAAARGLIPFARVEAVLSAQYDPDFVTTFMDLVESDRVAYQKAQAAAAEAEKRATNRRIDLGQLQQAVLTNVLDLARFRQALRDRNINDDDADLLTATLQQRKADLDDAKRKRAAADAAAKIKHIDLTQLESLVRRGARSIADYDAQLAELGFDDASRAAMAELLQLQIADDEKARKVREDAAARLRNKGVSLETERRAVVLELASVDDYERFLQGQGFTSDAIALMIAEARHDLADAQAARARRQQADQAAPPRAIPLADVRRAAKLGIIDVATYQARLEADGYSADDIEIDTALLTQEIADVQAARQKAQAADQAKPSGLSLTQLGAAVRAGVKHLEDYRAAAIANGTLSADDVNTLVRVLADELAASNAARVRRQALGSTLAAHDVSIGALEGQVRAGTLSVAGYVQALESAGLDAVDVDLLSTLLVDELTASTGL